MMNWEKKNEMRLWREEEGIEERWWIFKRKWNEIVMRTEEEGLEEQWWIEKRKMKWDF
jgi:hypothetical protein